MFRRRDLKHYVLNSLGWRTSEKIVVFQSDDWGSVRIPSRGAKEMLETEAEIDTNDPYFNYDSLESGEDMEALFDVLQSVRDGNGNHAVITANCLMGNPDFKRIKDSDYEEYFFENIHDSFTRYKRESVFSLWQQGRQEGIFVPQFHGREHVNVCFWLEKLKEGHRGVRHAFEAGVFGVRFKNIDVEKANFQAAWDHKSASQALYTLDSIKHGMKVFVEYFGTPSLTAIAPAYVWSEAQQNLLWELGVKSMQGISYQYVPPGNEGRKIFRFTRQSTSNKMGYQVRNVFFEPALLKNLDTVVDECLRRIEIAFQMKKPAIVGTHRINFMGELVRRNRSENLSAFRELLSRIVKRWPDVQFLGSDELSKKSEVSDMTH